MNERGFTLVELLAVILLIALLAALVLPQVLTQFSNNTAELSEQQIQMIEEAGLAYVELNNGSYAGKESCISLSSLVSADLLNEGFVKKTLGDNYNVQKSLKVTYSSTSKTYTVKLKDGKC